MNEGDITNPQDPNSDQAPPAPESLDTLKNLEPQGQDPTPEMGKQIHKKLRKRALPKRISPKRKSPSKLFDDNACNEKRKLWQETIIDYLSNPFDLTPVAKFCRETGIPPSSYYDYLKNNRVEIFAEAAKRRKDYMNEMRVRAYKALGNRMKISDRSLQMVLEMTGDYTPKSETRIEYTSPEEKKARIKALLEKIAQKQGPGPTQDSAPI